MQNDLSQRQQLLEKVTYHDNTWLYTLWKSVTFSDKKHLSYQNSYYQGLCHGLSNIGRELETFLLIFW